MTTTKAGAHTQGRLKVNKYGNIATEQGDALVVQDGCVSIADMRRLAACWNACEGIDTDNLEKFPGWARNGFALGVKIMDELAAERALLAESLTTEDDIDVAERIAAFLKGEK